MTDLEKSIFNIGKWLGNKLHYEKISKYNGIKSKTVHQGEVWYCDLGFNIGQEKNKRRPVLVLSNNSVNKSGKVVVACITDAEDKIKRNSNVPNHNTWYLLYSDTTDTTKMFRPTRTIPRKAHSYSFLDKDCIVQCEEIRSVSKARLDRNKLGDVHTDDLVRIKDKIKNTFDI